MSESRESAGHRREIVEQFTRQAAPFARLHAVDETVRLMIEASGVRKSDRVLDVACGPGLVACAFAEVAREVVGVDLTPAMLEKGAALQRERGLQNVSWVRGDVTALPFEEGAFDVVVSRYALHHVEQADRAVAEMGRVCAARGRVVVADVYVESSEQGAAYDEMERWRDPSHVRALGLTEFRRVMGSGGLEVVGEAFCRFEVAVEKLLEATCTPLEGARRVRELVAADVGVNRLGIEAAWRAGGGAGELRFSFPIVIVAARKG